MNAHFPRPLGTGQSPTPMAGKGEAALIARGAGKWGDPEFPKTDWVCVDIADLGEPDEICQMCEYKAIRHVQHLQHPSGRELRTGCICAGYLTGDLDAAQRRDADMRNAANRLRDRKQAVTKYEVQLQRHPSALSTLRDIQRRAVDLARKTTQDYEKHRTMSHFLLEMDANALVGQANDAVEEAERRSPAIRLQRKLADPYWWSTRKGQRFESGQGDVVQAFRRDRGGYSFGYQLSLGPMTWSPHRYATMGAAKRAGLRALAIALRRAGRLPRP